MSCIPRNKTFTATNTFYRGESRRFSLLPKGFAFALLRAIYLPFVFGHKRFAAKSALSWLVVSMISGSCGCILRRFRIVRSLFYLVEFATSSTTKFITPAIVPFVFAPAIQARHLLHIELFAQECSASYRTCMRMSVFIDCKNLATHNTRSLFGRVLVLPSCFALSRTISLLPHGRLELCPALFANLLHCPHPCAI